MTDEEQAARANESDAQSQPVTVGPVPDSTRGDLPAVGAEPGPPSTAQPSVPELSETASTLSLLLLFLQNFGFAIALTALPIIAYEKRRKAGSWKFGKAWFYWLIGMLIALDFPYWGIGDYRYTFQWAISDAAIHLIGTSCVYFFIVATKGGKSVAAGSWELGAPLIAGTLLADIGAAVRQIYFDAAFESPGATQSFQIDHEYYAQIVQVIPVLLVALATEIVFFSRAQGVAGRNLRLLRTFVIVVVCVIGEFLSLMMLVIPVASRNLGDVYDALELLSFRFSLEGVGMALVALAWAIGSAVLANEAHPAVTEADEG